MSTDRTSFIAQARFLKSGDITRGVRRPSLAGPPEIIVRAEHCGATMAVTYMVVGERTRQSISIPCDRRVAIRR